jgi:hypothetical protein
VRCIERAAPPMLSSVLTSPIRTPRLLIRS